MNRSTKNWLLLAVGLRGKRLVSHTWSHEIHLWFGGGGTGILEQSDPPLLYLPKRHNLVGRPVKKGYYNEYIWR